MIICRFVGGHKISVHLVNYQRVQMLNQMVRGCVLL